MLNINSPLKITSKLTLNNRVVVAPMASGTSSNEGFVTQKTLDHYKKLSLSQTSLIMVEYAFVDKMGKDEPFQLGIDQDEHIRGLTELADLIHKSHSFASIQLAHAGGKTTRVQSGGKLFSPSGVKVPVKDKELEVPDVASLAEIDNFKNAFIQAAIRANKAGFDIIEIHAAHGYGLNQWLSPLTNKRDDQYGGDLKNRSRILLEIIEGILEQIPHAILSVRIPGSDHFPGGLTNQDSIDLSKMLKTAGVSLINVSSGIGGWRRPRDRNGEGYLVDDAHIISKEVNIPVIGVGGIKTAEYINKGLK